MMIMLLVIGMIPLKANAHAPGSVSLSYNFSAQNLTVTISHSVSSTTSHYIKTVTVYKNSVQVKAYSYTSQPTTNTFSYYYNVTASDGDTLSAKADCSIGGSRSGSTTATAPDETDPTVQITSPSNATEVTSASLTVSGTASDNKGINKVQLKVNDGTWTDASGKTSWTRQVTLAEGSNNITARAIDTSDNYGEHMITVVYNATPPPDETPPTVSIQSPSHGSQFDVDSITVSGSASDNEDVMVVDVRVNSGTWTTASGTVSWSIDVSLIEGNNLIEARATDTSDNTEIDSITLNYSPAIPPDTTKPIVTIEAPQDDAVTTTEGVTISGTASDDRGVAVVEARINSGMWNAATGTTSWSIKFNLLEGDNTIEVRALDDAGNIGRSSIDVTYDPGEPPDTEDPVISIESPVEDAVFNNDVITISGTASDNSCTCRVEVNVNGGNLMMATGRQSWSIEIVLEEGENFITARVTDDSGNVGFDTLTIFYEILEPEDTASPQITIVSPVDDATVTNPRLTVQGTAFDEKGLEKVEVMLNQDSWRAVSGTTSWNIDLVLVEGDNTIKARATDLAGNVKEASVTITYNIPYIPGGLDGIIDDDEYTYSRSFDDGNYTLFWGFLDEDIMIGIAANTTGWVSIGFDATEMMLDADMIIGGVDDQNRVYIFDSYSTGTTGPHPADVDLGGIDNIIDFGGTETDGRTVIEFTRSANSTDLYDENIFQGQILDIIWGYSSSDEFSGYHDLHRGYVNDFEFTPQPPADDDDDDDDTPVEGDEEDNGGSGGIIIIAAVSMVIILILIAVVGVVIFLFAKKKEGKDEEEDDDEDV